MVSSRSLFVICFCALASPLVGAPPSKSLFLAQSGNIKSSLEVAQSQNPLNYEELRQLSTLILEKGSLDYDPQVQLLTLYGMTMSQKTDIWTLYDRGIKSSHPQLQLSVVLYLGRIPDERAVYLLEKALMSNYYLVRLEAAFQLAQRRETASFDKIEALMHKVPQELLPFFAQIYSCFHDRRSLHQMRQLIGTMDPQILLEVIMAAAHEKIYDLRNDIRCLATHHQASMKEACFYALSSLDDEASSPLYEEGLKSQYPYVRLSAARSLYKMGKKECLDVIIQMASSGDLFAIMCLGDLQEGRLLLTQLTQHDSIEIRMNAALALLESQKKESLPVLEELFLDAQKDIALLPTFSPGRSFMAFSVIPNASQQLASSPQGVAAAIRINERVLEGVFGLGEEVFLPLARKLFEKNRKSLIPKTISLIANFNTSTAKEFLKTGHQMLGAPFTRMWCSLALYQLNEPGPYEQDLFQFAKKHRSLELLDLKPPPERTLFMPMERYELSCDEKTSLLMATYMALARSHSREAIDVLLEAMIQGHPANVYALAGLLYVATD